MTAIWSFGNTRVGICDLARSLVHLVRPLLLEVDYSQHTSTLVNFVLYVLT